MMKSDTFLGQWTIPGDQPPMVWITRQQILNQNIVTELELRRHPDVEWDHRRSSYWVARSKPIWTWLQLKGLVDDTLHFPPN